MAVPHHLGEQPFLEGLLASLQAFPGIGNILHAKRKLKPSVYQVANTWMLILIVNLNSNEICRQIISSCHKSQIIVKCLKVQIFCLEIMFHEGGRTETILPSVGM